MCVDFHALVPNSLHQQRRSPVRRLHVRTAHSVRWGGAQVLRLAGSACVAGQRQTEDSVEPPSAGWAAAPTLGDEAQSVSASAVRRDGGHIVIHAGPTQASAPVQTHC